MVLWANSFKDGIGYDEIHATTILIPDNYGEFDYEKYLKKIIKSVFEEELEFIYLDFPDGDLICYWWGIQGFKIFFIPLLSTLK